MTRAPSAGSTSGGATTSPAKRRALVGLFFLAGYVVPLFAPPGPQPILPPAPHAPLLDRLFPTVPGWWVVARLVCLVVGALLIACARDRPAPVHVLRLRRGTRSRRPGPSGNATVAALAIAVAQALLSFRVALLSRPLQLAYFAVLALPTALLWLSARWGAWRAPAAVSPRRLRTRRAWLAVALVLALWIALRVPAALHSPRAATPIDFWLNFQWLTEAVTDDRNMLTSSSEPGVPDTYMLFVGAPLLRAAKLTPSLTWIQAFHTVWIVTAAAALALLVALTVGRVAAPLAVATLLFSPLLLMLHLVPAPLGLMILFTVALLLLTRQVYACASVTGLAALGAVAGVSTTFLHVTLFAAAAIVAVVVRAFRTPRLPWQGLVIAAATFLAATLPAAPNVTMLRAMVAKHVQLNWQWAGAEAVLLGQRSPRRAPDIAALMQAGRAAPYDVVLGGLLTPFMAPRSAMRLCGDALFEPIGAALAAVGLAACLRRPTRRGAAALLVVCALALLPAVASTASDRASLTRSIGTPVAVALLAAVGFQTLRRALLARRRASLACSATVAASMLAGVVLFDVVTPRLIAASSLEIITAAARDVRDPSGVTVLGQVEPYPPLGWLHEGHIAQHLLAQPLPTWRFEGPQNLEPPAGGRVPNLFFWSPGLEEDRQVSQAICARWPGAALYTFQDRAALSRAFGANRSGPQWRPALPATQWSVGGCDALAGRLHGRF